MQKCFLSNSSEKISFSFPQFGHLQIKDVSFLNLSKPGQCWGDVVILGPLRLDMFQMMQIEGSGRSAYDAEHSALHPDFLTPHDNAMSDSRQNRNRSIGNQVCTF